MRGWVWWFCSLSLSAWGAHPLASPKNRPYDVSHYRIELRLGEGGAYEGKTTLKLKAKRSLPTLELDALGYEVKGVTVDGARVDFKRNDDRQAQTGTLTLKPAKALPSGRELTVVVDYTGKASVKPDWGFYTVPSDTAGGLPFYFTHFEPEGAQQLFPCNDDPADKATTELLAVVDGRYQVLSNGTKETDEAFAAEGRNLRRVHWVQSQPHSTYLVALAIGDFEALTLTGSVPATLYLPRGKSELAFVAADATPALIATQARILSTPYPWAKYDQVAVPHYLYGGMENTSLVLARENMLVLNHRNDLLSRPSQVSLISHELAHQWFGDLVTLKWWNDTWLNEGFATYLGDRAVAEYYGNDMVAVGRAEELLTGYFRIEKGPRAHALIIKDLPTIQDGFDSISYQKGAAVLQMLELWVGDAQLRKVLKDYLAKFGFKNATSQDFFAMFGKDVRPFHDAWLNKKGYPVITPSVSFSGNTATVTITQRPIHADQKGPFVFKLPVVFHRESSPSFHEERTILVDKPSVTVKFELPAAPQWVNWNKGLTALTTVESSAVSEQAWALAARSDPDPVWRYQAQLALLGELVNPDATVPTRPSENALTTVLETLTKDPSPYVREAVLNRLGESPHTALPADLGPVVLSLAKRPDNLTEDALGMVRVRASALEVLGKVDYPAGKEYLLAEIEKNELDINFAGAIAVGVARIGDSPAQAALRAAIRTQKSRGYPFFRATAQALGAGEEAGTVALIREALNASPGDNEILRVMLHRVRGNERLKQSKELAAFVRDFVNEESAYSEELKVRVMHLIERQRSPEAKEAWQAMSERAPTQRLKANAQQIFARSFPTPKTKK
ncbi:MAG: M1 family aminopeptidase [Myxococcaceae bacterium]